MTETAKVAHVVLPVCSFVEKTGTYTNLERRVQRLNPFRLPRGQSRSDFDIFLQLLKLLEFSAAGETPEAIFEEVGRFVPTYQGLEDGEQWPKGFSYLYSENFEGGKAKLIPVEGRRVDPLPGDYPFQLIQRPSLFRSGLLSLKSDTLRKVSEEPHLEMNPEDAQAFKIEEGEAVQVSTDRGLSFRMKVKSSSRLVSRVISVPCSFAPIEQGAMVSAKVETLKRN